MAELSYSTNWNSMSDQALNTTLGVFVKQHRLNQNKSQEDVAEAANISRSTLSLLERGKTVNLTTFLRVLRVLDLLYIMDTFQTRTQISPIKLAKLEREKRQRAGHKKDINDTKSDW